MCPKNITFIWWNNFKLNFKFSPRVGQITITDIYSIPSISFNLTVFIKSLTLCLPKVNNVDTGKLYRCKFLIPSIAFLKLPFPR